MAIVGTTVEGRAKGGEIIWWPVQSNLQALVELCVTRDCTSNLCDEKAIIHSSVFKFKEYLFAIDLSYFFKFPCYTFMLRG
jgi:hypothetical protein